MKKNEVVNEIAKRSGLPKAECDKVIDLFVDVIKDALVEGDRVIIRGFLTFEVSEYRARDGYNPQTGRTQRYGSVKTVKCKVGKPIKDAINGISDEE